MRDSFGGVFMIRLFLVFIFIYVAFAAVSLNYAKGFKIKNQVIDFIEENEIIDLGGPNFNNKLDDLGKILDDANYNNTCESINKAEGSKKENNQVIEYCYRGIVITKESQVKHPGTDAEDINYKISVHVDWNIGVLNKILVLGGQKENSQESANGSWTIVGKAKVVKRN